MAFVGTGATVATWVPPVSMTQRQQDAVTGPLSAISATMLQATAGSIGAQTATADTSGYGIASIVPFPPACIDDPGLPQSPALLGGHVQFNLNDSFERPFLYGQSVSPATAYQVAVPHGGRITKIFADCDAAVATGTKTFKLYHNGATVEATLVIANGTASKSKDANISVADGDTFRWGGTGTNPGTAVACRVFARLEGTTGHRNHFAYLNWGAQAPGDACGLTSMTSGGAPYAASPQTCVPGQAGGWAQTRIVAPVAGKVAGLFDAVSQNPGLLISATAIYNITTGAWSDMEVTLDRASGKFSDADYETECTQGCTFAAGDSIVARALGSTSNAHNAMSVEFDTPQFFTSHEPRWSGGTKWGLPYGSWLATPPSLTAPFAGSLQNFFVWQGTTDGVFTATVCSAPSGTPDCSGTRPTAILSSVLQVSDTAHVLPIAEGQHVNVQVTSPGVTTSDITWSIAYAPQPDSASGTTCCAPTDPSTAACVAPAADGSCPPTYTPAVGQGCAQ
jgi:hypothetical protein